MRTRNLVMALSFLTLACSGNSSTLTLDSQSSDAVDEEVSTTVDGGGEEDVDDHHCKPGGFEKAKNDLCYQCDEAGVSYVGAGIPIDDQNECTQDECDPDQGVVHLPLSDLDCDDLDDTTWGDTCVDGLCVGNPPVCTGGEFYVDDGNCFLCAPDGSGPASQAQPVDDGNPCTDDSCDPQGGPKHLPNTLPCDDGDPGTINDTCDNAECVGDPQICTPGEYFVEDGACLQCNEDGSAGMEGETINDGNLCTDDLCDPVNGLSHTNNTVPCVDGDPMTIEDTCVDGACVGIPLECEPGNWFAEGDLCFQCADDGLSIDGDGESIDDGNPCTDDLCDVDDGVTHDDNDLPCDDGDPLTANDQCVEGECVGTDITCEAGEYFVEDGACKLCDEDGAGPVDDGLPLDDGNLCTDDLCHVDDGLAHSPNNLPCDDGDDGTVNDVCANGLCSGTVIECAPNEYLLQNGLCAQCNADGTGTVDAGASTDDGNPCTDGACDASQGVVQSFNNDPCDDGDEETVNDVCSQGTCAGDVVICEAGEWFAVDGQCQLCSEDGTQVAQELAIDDANPCTDDSCDAVDGVVHENNSDECDDGNEGTTDDQCVDGACVGELIVCPKGDYYEEDGLCFLCNGDGTGSVGPGDPIVDDNNVCTNDVCDPGDGAVHYPLWNDPCDDGDPNTGNDRCKEGVCVGDPIICIPNQWEADGPWWCALCDATGTGFDGGEGTSDSNDCTQDLCDADQGVLHIPLDGDECWDSNDCTIDDTCVQGQCVGAPLDCDDNSVCTQDSCDPDTGCLHVPVAGDCDDGNDLTTDDQCVDGQCVGTPVPVVCDADEWFAMDGQCSHCNSEGSAVIESVPIDDGNLCTDDSCDVDGVSHENNTVECDDGNDATIDDQCLNGVCVGDVVVCPKGDYYENNGLCYLCNGDGTGAVGPGVLIEDDGNVCTKDVCDPGDGFVHYPLWNDPCDDGDPNTGDDKCDAGVCAGDPIICTPNQWEADGPWWCQLCDATGTEFVDGEGISDSNDCTDDVCDPLQGVINTPLDGVECWDSNDCTLDDMCVAGECTGTPLACDDYSDCTQDSCDPESGCVFTPVAGDCDDGIALTLDDTCIKGICVGMVDPDGDGIPNYGDGPACDGPGLVNNCVDNCPFRANANQVDGNNDGAGDACTFPRWWTRIDTTEKVIALTFDDGWSQDHLLGLLKVLHEKGARASFFLLGKYMEDGVLEPWAVKAILTGGHTLGNHTYNHEIGNNLGESVAEINLGADTFLNTIGEDLRPIFRAPSAVLVPWYNTALVQTGFSESVLGNFDSEDWTDVEPDPQLLADCIVNMAAPGDIIGMHVGPDATVAALPAIIDGLHAKGYTLLNIEQLMAYGPPVIIDESQVKSCSSYYEGL